MDIGLAPKTNYVIKTTAYEGPFELLIDLIEKRKLLVNDISLSAVTDDFIQLVRGKADFPMEDATNFIAVAATLLLIKSRSLIPDLELSDEEEQSIADLEARLRAYERTREAARELGKLFGKTVLFEGGDRLPEPFFSPAKDLTLSALSDALSKALLALEKTQEAPEARVKPTVTIEEMMTALLSRVQKSFSTTFSEASRDAKGKVELIVSFLALLELMREGTILAEQQAPFGDISLKSGSATTPHYG